MLHVVWEYRIRPERKADFEKHYAKDGTWAVFFRRSTAYRGTILARSPDEPHRYVTIDEWESLQAFREFHAEQAREYDALDRACGALTMEERLVGVFEAI